MGESISQPLGEDVTLVLLHELTWPQAKEHYAANDVVLLPVGSNEQHGPQNPLGTDHLIAGAIAEQAASRTGVLCLQIIPFGVSSHHKKFWGTIFVSPNTLGSYVKDVCLALCYYGARKIVVVNGHGGNTPILSEIARELREEGAFVSLFAWWNASGRRLPHIFTPEERRHAGAEETSVNLALHPNLVSMKNAVDEEPRRRSASTESVLPLYTADVSSSGVFGKSTSAKADKGQMILNEVVKALCEHIHLLKKTNLEDLLQLERL